MSTIYATLNVPTATSHVALQTVQWTPDGQLCLTTKSSAYIMTPDHGINFDKDSAIRPALNAKERDAGKTTGWFRTMIQFNKLVPFKWPEHSQGWGMLSLGLMDFTLCAVAFSPSGLSSEAGCIAATLSSNMDLHLWAPVKNFLKGEWKMILEVTPYLFGQFLPEGTREDSAIHVLKAQIVSITWSPQCDFGHYPSLTLNGSLLVAGNRAGSLIFVRFSTESQSVELAGILEVSDTWITQVSVTPWYTVEQGQCVSCIAYGTADGSVGIVRLTQELTQKHHPHSTPSFAFVEYDIALTAQKLPYMVHESDGAGITALQWVHSPVHREIVVHCTPGRVHLHYPSIPFTTSTTHPIWTTRSVRLKSQHTSTASSALHPPSGLTYLHADDKLILTLSDGSINVLQTLSSDNPHLVEEPEAKFSSKLLSTNARSVFVTIERGEVDKQDMNKITGMTGYNPDNGVFVWSHEVHRPGDFSYKHDAKQKAMLAVATLWEPVAGDVRVLCDMLRMILEGTKAVSGRSPLNILRPVLSSLRDEKKLGVLHSQVLDILESGIPSSDNMVAVMGAELSLSNWKGKGREGVAHAISESMRKGFRQSVVRHLFGWDAVASWRLRLGLADYVWDLSDNPERRAACGVVAQGMLTKISGHIFQTLVKHILALSPFLTDADAPFARRLSTVVQTLLRDNATRDLVNEAQQILEIVRSIETEDIIIMEESCPACGAEVPFKDIRGAVCANGHVWTRCSVTTFILSTAFVRTCVGCKRKTFLAPVAVSTVNGDEARMDHLPAVARSWIVEELLEAVRRCLFCGNAFVCIV